MRPVDLGRVILITLLLLLLTIIVLASVGADRQNQYQHDLIKACIDTGNQAKGNDGILIECTIKE